jgi:Cdc6-related protein, AAA superfamily ATPase
MLNAGLICISGSPKTLAELEERVASRLHPYTVSFPGYSRRELLEILMHRAERALAEGSYSLTALKQIARIARGDARAAIRMLHKAAVLADHRRVDRITTDTLKEQIEADRETRTASVLDNLTEDHRILYQIIKRQERILSGDLWEAYLDSCAKAKRKPLAPRTFSEYCNRLVHAGLIGSERARIRGKVRMFKMNMQ